METSTGSAPRSWRIDAFTAVAGGGNPAAVCPLEGWLSDEVMQEIARVNALSETAFLVAGPAPGPTIRGWPTSICAGLWGQVHFDD